MHLYISMGRGGGNADGGRSGARAHEGAAGIPSGGRRFLKIGEDRKRMPKTYAKSGVDVKAVRAIQQRIEALVAGTATAHTPRFLLGHYAGLFEAGGQTLTMHTDGVGSKVLVASEMGRHDTIGMDAVAMNANDIICVGSRPIVAVDYLAMSRADDALVGEIMKGLVSACQECGMALIGGETAMLPEMITGPKGTKTHYDLAVTAVGTMEGPPVIGDKMGAGDTLIGLASTGLHSNGYTLARKLLSVKEWGEELLAPTRQYVQPVMEMVGSGKVHGLAHITGGAFSKLRRIGAYANVGFELDGMPEMEQGGLFAALAKKVKSDYELYRTFNMGVGMVVACPQEAAEYMEKIAAKYKIKSSRIGRVISKDDVILHKGGKKISLL